MTPSRALRQLARAERAATDGNERVAALAIMDADRIADPRVARVHGWLARRALRRAQAAQDATVARLAAQDGLRHVRTAIDRLLTADEPVELQRAMRTAEVLERMAATAVGGAAA